MEALVFLAVFGLIGGGIVAGVRNEHNKTSEAWANAAHALGFSASSRTAWFTQPSMTGMRRGVSVQVDVESTGDDNSQFTRFQLRYSPGDTPQVVLKKQNFFGALFRNVVGKPGLEVGDFEFDQAIHIQGNDPAAVIAYLTPARRMAALTVFEGSRRAVITERSIEMQVVGIIKDANVLVSTVNRLVDIALVMSAPDGVDMALAQQAAGDLGEAAQSLHEMNEVGDPNSFTQLLEAEALVAMGDGAAASTVLEGIDGHDPELDGWRAVAKSHPSPVSETPAHAANVSLDQDDVIRDLFTQDRLGYEMEKHFFATYEGSVVHWNGTVSRTREFRSDRDFGGSGVKATIMVGSRGDGRFLSDQVHAIVQLPSGTELRTGQRVSFRGRFIRADRFMRNLFVADARLS